MVDATVLVAGIVWPRFPHEVLQHGLRGDFQLVLSRHVITQARRRIRERFPAYAEGFERFLAHLICEEVENPPLQEISANPSLVRDHSDIPIALSAINAGVDYFVSDDKDFTAPDEPIHDKLHVLQSGTFLNKVMGHSHEDLDQIKRRTWADMPGHD